MQKIEIFALLVGFISSLVIATCYIDIVHNAKFSPSDTDMLKAINWFILAFYIFLMTVITVRFSQISRRIRKLESKVEKLAEKLV